MTRLQVETAALELAQHHLGVGLRGLRERLFALDQDDVREHGLKRLLHLRVPRRLGETPHPQAQAI